MTSTKPKTLTLPAGPETPYDINTTDESFPKVADYIAEYGNFCLVKPILRGNNSILINDPDAVKAILVKNHENYKKGPGFERVKMLLGNGIIVSDSAFWRRQRRKKSKNAISLPLFLFQQGYGAVLVIILVLWRCKFI